MPRPRKGQEHPKQDVAEKIKLMTAIGVTHRGICGVLKMSPETLQNHYRDALDYGSDTANTVVGGKIFEAAKRGEQWACTLWAARRMGWKETVSNEHSGPGGGPIQTIDTAKLSKEQLAALASIRIPADGG